MSSPNAASARPRAVFAPVASSSSEPAGSEPAPLSLVGLEFSLDTATLDALEAVGQAFTREAVRRVFARIGSTEEVALLTTCHRVELLLLTSSPEALGEWRDSLPGEATSWRLREGPDVVHHLFRVAAGRESLAVGEAEVRHQVRAAAGGVESRHPRSVLRELFVGAADAADELYPSVAPARSIASVAAAHLLDLIPSPCPTVLVIGSGTVGRQVTERLASRARVTVVYHQRAPDEAFLTETGARAVKLDRMAPELAACDAVVTAAKFGGHGLDASDLPRDRPVVLVDLGVPRNIDPTVRALPNVRLVDLQELHALPLRSSTEDDDLRVAERAGRFSEGIEPLLLEPWIDAIRRAAEDLRRSELARARTFLGSLDPSQEAAVERLTQRLVARLLREPTERIRSLPPGPDGDRQRRLALALLRPTTPDP